MRRALTALLTTALVATACTAGTPTPATDPPPVPTTAAAAGDFPVTVEADNGQVTIEARPERIVSLSSAATEILFEIGAGDQVVVADSFSDYPPEAPTDPELIAFEILRKINSCRFFSIDDLVVRGVIRRIFFLGTCDQPFSKIVFVGDKGRFIGWP